MNNRRGGARQNQGPAPNEIGAAWIKQSQDGSEYISISFNENVYNFDLANCFVDMYVNEHKQNPKAPDYRVKAKAKGQQPQRGPRPPQQRQQQAPQRPQMPRPRNFAPQSAGAPAPKGTWDPEDPGDDGGNY